MADSVEALAGLAEGGGPGLGRLDAALARLRAVDDKSYLAYALNAAALLSLRRGWRDVAAAYAEEALAVALAIQRHNEIAIAEAMLARIRAGPRAGPADERFRRLCKRAADRDRFSARARACIQAAADTGPAMPAPAAKRSAGEGKHGSRKPGDRECHASSSSEASSSPSRKRS